MPWFARLVAINRADITTLSGTSASRRMWLVSRLFETLSEFLASTFIATALYVAATVYAMLSLDNAWAVAVAYGLSTAAALAVLAAPPVVARPYGNGVVSLAAMLLGVRSVLHTLLLMVAQFAGYLVGAYLTHLMLDSAVATAVPLVSQGKAYWIGLVLSSVVAFGYLVVTLDAYPSANVPRSKQRRDHYAASLAVGALVVISAWVSLAVGTVGVLHFWQYFGPAIVEGDFTAWWNYLLVTLSAALSVAIVYRLYEYWISYVVGLNALVDSQVASIERFHCAADMRLTLNQCIPSNDRAAVEPLLTPWLTCDDSVASATTVTALVEPTPLANGAGYEMGTMSAAATTTTTNANAATSVPVFMATSRRHSALD